MKIVWTLLYEQMKGRRNSWQKYNADVILKGQRKWTLTPLSLSSIWWKPLNDIFSPYHLWQCNFSVFWLTRMFHTTHCYTQCCTILTKRILLKVLKPISFTFPQLQKLSHIVSVTYQAKKPLKKYSSQLSSCFHQPILPSPGKSALFCQYNHVHGHGTSPHTSAKRALIQISSLF